MWLTVAVKDVTACRKAHVIGLDADPILVMHPLWYRVPHPARRSFATVIAVQDFRFLRNKVL